MTKHPRQEVSPGPFAGMKAFSTPEVLACESGLTCTSASAEGAGPPGRADGGRGGARVSRRPGGAGEPPKVPACEVGGGREQRVEKPQGAAHLLQERAGRGLRQKPHDTPPLGPRGAGPRSGRRRVGGALSRSWTSPHGDGEDTAHPCLPSEHGPRSPGPHTQDLTAPKSPPKHMGVRVSDSWIWGDAHIQTSAAVTRKHLVKSQVDLEFAGWG